MRLIPLCPFFRSGYTVIPGSHKSTAETPAHLLTGGVDWALESLGLLQQPPLRPGDVLVVAASAIHGLRHPVSNGMKLFACPTVPLVGSLSSLSEAPGLCSNHIFSCTAVVLTMAVQAMQERHQLGLWCATFAAIAHALPMPSQIPLRLLPKSQLGPARLLRFSVWFSASILLRLCGRESLGHTQIIPTVPNGALL